MTDAKNDNFIIYESSINNNDTFEVLESVSTFSHNEFSKQMKDEMEFYSINLEMLSISTNISKFRLSALLNRNAEFTIDEINIIRKRLHF